MMLSHKDTQKILKEEQTTNWLALCLVAIKDKLPPALHAAAYALLNHDEQGKTIVFHLSTPEMMQNHRQAVERGVERLAELSTEERIAIFSALVPHAALTVEAAWQLLGSLPYQMGWQRRAFRAPTHEQVQRAKRLAWIRGIIPQLACYREKDLAWFAAWTPYLAAYHTQPFGVLFAAAINEGGPEGVAIFEVLVASARGEHMVGKMGRHVTTGLLVASRPDGWNCIERLLLAAQREEGLRQVILETVDEAHPQAFRRMLQLILEHDLIRFSSTVRAADVWFGFGRKVEDASDLRTALRAVLPLLENPARCHEAIAYGHPQNLYFGLWARAFTDARAAVSAALSVLSDPLPERRLAAVYLLGQLQLPEARHILVPLLDDPDLRVALQAFAGIASDVSQDQHDIFEHLMQLLKRIQSRSQTMKSGIWPWLEISATPGALLHMLLQCLGARDPKCLIPSLSLMNVHDRIELARKLAALPAWDEEVRNALYQLVGERNRWASEQARALLETRPLDEESTLALEQLLTRKNVELRRGLLALLLKGNDEAVLRSARRLLAQPHVPSRLAGLDLLKGLIGERRDVQSATEMANAYRANREHITVEEAILLEAIRAAGDTTNIPTSENVLGLISPDQRSPVLPPRQRVVTIDTPAARNCLRSLDALIEEHRTVPLIVKTWRGSEEYLLGNVGLHFPYPKPALTIEEDEQAHLPLVEVWLKWERERSAALRDADGLELVRAALLLHTTRATPTVLHEENAHSWPNAAFQGMPALAIQLAGDAPINASTEESATSPTPVPEKMHLTYVPLLRILIHWLIRRQGMSTDTLNFLLDTAEAALATVTIADLVAQEADQQRPRWHRSGLRDKLTNDGSLIQLRFYRAWYHQHWEAEQQRRYWQLLHWLDEPTPGLPRMRPAFDVLMDAYQVGAANEADILDQLGGPETAIQRSHYYDLRMLSTRTPSHFIDTYPVLHRIVATLRARILEIELGRGDLPTVATDLALALRYSGGIALFVRLVTLLQPTDLARGYTYDNQGKGTTLSHLLRVSSPAPEESLEECARQITAAHLDPERLVAAALYAPQWGQHVEYVLGWPSLSDAIWWIYAHTRGSNWSVDAEIRQTWQTHVAERTTVSAEDLQAGAVDVMWFWNSYHGLGSERWEKVYSAAKYASDGTGHGRARLYADAMSGKVSALTLRQRMFEKRQQDCVRALGLVPLPAERQECEGEIVARYQALQEFKQTGRTYGAQRWASEETAVRIGMENLARTAGFADPLRLQWAMEARTGLDLLRSPLTMTEGEVRLTLELDDHVAEPRIQIIGRTGKCLKTVPARLKKHPEVMALIERQREITQQLARMRPALEAAMCRGDHFTVDEILEFLRHPVLSRLLRTLIFIQDTCKRVSGYPVCSESESGPQLFLRDYTGTMTPVQRTVTDLRLVHSHDLYIGQAWSAWQHECFTAARTQPLKQVFRELYVCTAHEMRHGDEVFSQRYSGHQVQPRQAHAVLGQRGWVTGYEEGLRRTFHVEKLTARVSFAQGIFTPTEVEGLTVEHVYFQRLGTDKLVPLAEIPPRVFSETMRDLDLMVSVAHSGGVDPETTASTVEMRAALLHETCMLLGLENVTIRSAHALIEGTLGIYTVHLGSAVVHKQPGGALCIIPVHAQHQGRIFLPFADNDPRTAEVMTKVITLARDSALKDPSILEQILPVT